jgi:hypothetical protein
MQPVDPNYIWGLSGPALVLYVVAVALFVAIVSANLRVIEALTEGAKARKPAVASGFALFITFVSNLVGAATIAVLARTSGTSARMSMVALPLLFVAERHLRAAIKDVKDRTVHLCALTGSVAGLLAGAWFLLRGVVGQEQVRHAEVSGTVRTLRVEEAMAHPQNWTISVQLAAAYLVSLALFWGVHWGLKLSSDSMAEDLRKARPRALLTALVSALVLNFFAVGALLLIGQYANVPIRLAMLAVPLFIVSESYLSLLRSERENRFAHWAGLVGSAAGIAGAAFFLLKGAPYY